MRAERWRPRPLGPERRQQEREPGQREQREHQTRPHAWARAAHAPCQQRKTDLQGVQVCGLACLVALFTVHSSRRRFILSATINISGVFRQRTNAKQPLPNSACPNTQRDVRPRCPGYPAAKFRPVPRRAIGTAVPRSRPAPARRGGSGGRAASARSTRKHGRPAHRSRPLPLVQRPPSRRQPPAVLAPLKGARASAGADLARGLTAAPRARGSLCRRRGRPAPLPLWAAAVTAAVTALRPGGLRPGGRPAACGTWL